MRIPDLTITTPQQATHASPSTHTCALPCGRMPDAMEHAADLYIHVICPLYFRRQNPADADLDKPQCETFPDQNLLPPCSLPSARTRRAALVMILPIIPVPMSPSHQNISEQYIASSGTGDS